MKYREKLSKMSNQELAEAIYMDMTYPCKRCIFQKQQCKGPYFCIAGIKAMLESEVEE